MVEQAIQVYPTDTRILIAPFSVCGKTDILIHGNLTKEELHKIEEEIKQQPYITREFLRHTPARPTVSLGEELARVSKDILITYKGR